MLKSFALHSLVHIHSYFYVLKALYRRIGGSIEYRQTQYYFEDGELIGISGPEGQPPHPEE